MKKLLLLLFSHGFVGVIGFAGGIYALPILTAPTAPAKAEIETVAAQAQFKAEFRRDLKDSDLLHWGEGTVFVGRTAVSLIGELAPGPDYKLYLSPQFVETEAEFARLKDRMARVGDVKTFKNFMVAVPASIDPAEFNSVVVWCESFEQFITAAQYQ